MHGQPQKLLVDTGPLIALFVARDKHHHRAVEFTKSCTAKLFTTWLVVTEACFMLNARGKAALLAMLDSPALHVADLKATDIGRLRELVGKRRNGVRVQLRGARANSHGCPIIGL